mmetsp:Transcript_69351/g.174792  ORF Transcript_69351/g.174792 Transcript_69351/m.174792 type:complete len:239 (+) Transcript_69351:2217-2933(+)
MPPCSFKHCLASQATPSCWYSNNRSNTHLGSAKGCGRSSPTSSTMPGMVDSRHNNSPACSPACKEPSTIASLPPSGSRLASVADVPAFPTDSPRLGTASVEVASDATAEVSITAAAMGAAAQSWLRMAASSASCSWMRSFIAWAPMKSSSSRNRCFSASNSAIFALRAAIWMDLGRRRSASSADIVASRSRTEDPTAKAFSADGRLPAASPTSPSSSSDMSSSSAISAWVEPTPPLEA